MSIEVYDMNMMDRIDIDRIDIDSDGIYNKRSYLQDSNTIRRTGNASRNVDGHTTKEK